MKTKELTIGIWDNKVKGMSPSKVGGGSYNGTGWGDGISQEGDETWV